MQFIQKLEQAQKLNLTPSMRQALECLQLPALEMLQYVQEAALENPMLEVDLPSLERLSADAPAEPAVTQYDSWDDCFARRRTDGADLDPLAAAPAEAESLRDHLLAQIGQSALIDAKLQPLCCFLVDCLDSRGYLDCPLDVLAQETGQPLFQMEQALFAVQMLDPPGVGARSLSECLVLQLSQGPHFNALTLGLARGGLEQMAKKQYAELAKRFQTDKKSILAAVEVISRLNPIPSRGFGSHDYDAFVIPDAFITGRDGGLTVELNTAAQPRITIDSHYRALLESTEDPELGEYLRGKLQQANGLLRGVQARGQTLQRLVRYVAAAQRDFFTGGELHPMTIQSAAEALDISPSTVSRAVQDKYIQFGGRVLPLRSLFSTPAAYGGEGELSSVAVKQRLRSLVQKEDPAHPLSDEDLAAALAEDGVTLSRRTVAKYRAQMQIPPIAQRRARG